MSAGRRVDFTPGGKPITHGASAYRNHGCRCIECVDGHRINIAAARDRRASETPPPDAHGKSTTYQNWRCRCRACTAAHAAMRREQYAKARSFS